MSSSRQRDHADFVNRSIGQVPVDADRIPESAAIAKRHWIQTLLTNLTRRVARRHSTYSFVSGATAFVLFLTVVIDIVVDADRVTPPMVLASTLALSVGCTLVPVVMGRRYPRWAGLIPVSIIAMVSLYFIGFSDVDQSVLSSMQELPIIALYLGWFYRARLARGIMIVFSVFLVVAILLSPSFAANGFFSVQIGLASLAIMAFCFESGSYLQRELERHAVHDHLTGVFNRRGFGERFSIEIERSRRLGSTLIVAVIDFDHFKRVNDELGHAAGDELLRSSVRAWSLRLFDSDTLGRLGGDEFIMLLPQRTLREASELLELLRRASTHSWSWGLAEVRPDDDLESVIERADSELYARKAERGD